MRRGSVLTCWALACALLALCLILLQPRPDPQQDTPSPSADAPAYWMLYEKPLSAFTRLRVDLADGSGYTVASSMAFDASGALLGVYNSLGQPVTVEGQADFALDATAYQMMLLTAQHLPVTKRFEALDRAACGLDSPDARITAYYADGTSLSLSIGRLISSGASCYVSLAGDPAVYLAPYDLHDVMTRPLAAQHRLPGAIREEASTAAQLAVVGIEEERVIATRYGGEGRVLPWQIEAPYVHAGSTERIESLIGALCALHADRYVATVTDAAGLSAYGLDQPVRLVASFPDGVIRDVQLGGDAGDGFRYARLDRTGDIYLVSHTQLEFLSGAGLDSLLDRYVALVPISSMARLTVQAGGETAKLAQTWEEGAKEPSSRTLQGCDCPSQTFSTRYAAVVGVLFDQCAPLGAQAGETLARVHFLLRSGEEIEIVYSGYSAFYDLAETSAGGQFLIRKEKIADMLSALWEDHHETK